MIRLVDSVGRAWTLRPTDVLRSADGELALSDVVRVSIEPDELSTRDGAVLGEQVRAVVLRETELGVPIDVVMPLVVAQALGERLAAGKLVVASRTPPEGA